MVLGAAGICEVRILVALDFLQHFCRNVEQLQVARGTNGRAQRTAGDETGGLSGRPRNLLSWNAAWEKISTDQASKRIQTYHPEGAW